MFDAQTTALLRTIHAELCEPLSRYEVVAGTHVASRILEAAREGASAKRLRLAAFNALREIPSAPKVPVASPRPLTVGPPVAQSAQARKSSGLGPQAQVMARII
jgi:hypothetical protein